MKNRIRELRSNQKLSLPQLSEELLKKVNLKISPDALSKYERGKREPKLATWQKLADYFDVSIDYIMGIEDDEGFGEPMKNRIAELRKEHGCSQEILGEAIGISRQSVSLYETGKCEPKQGILIKLADYFGVSIDYLVYHEGVS